MDAQDAPHASATKRTIENAAANAEAPAKRLKLDASVPPTPPETLSSASTPTSTTAAATPICSTATAVAPIRTPTASSAPSSPRPRVYHCSFPPCASTFTRPCRLAEHERSHTGERPFVCSEPACGKSFSRDYHLSRHVALTHGGAPRSHVCGVEGCGKAFATSQRRREHEKTHERKREFACSGYEGCVEVFRKKSTLAAHVAKVHLGVKPFPCGRVVEGGGEVCAAAYDSQGKLNEHVRKWHSGPRFFCTLCSEAGGQDDIAGPPADTHHDDAPALQQSSSNTASTRTQPLGFGSLPALLQHRRAAHPSPKKPRGRPRKDQSSRESSHTTTTESGIPIPGPAPRRRANQHAKTSRAQALAGRSAADMLLFEHASEEAHPSTTTKRPSRPRKAATPPSRSRTEDTHPCLLPHCAHLFPSPADVDEHCFATHGMALAEIEEARREQEALSGGAFWLGGVEPGCEDALRAALLGEDVGGGDGGFERQMEMDNRAEGWNEVPEWDVLGIEEEGGQEQQGDEDVLRGLLDPLLEDVAGGSTL